MMNGILISSLDGGKLLYSHNFVPCFGLDAAGENSLQLSSSMFALYQMSGNGLNFIKKVILSFKLQFL